MKPDLKHIFALPIRLALATALPKSRHLLDTFFDSKFSKTWQDLFLQQLAFVRINKDGMSAWYLSDLERDRGQDPLDCKQQRYHPLRPRWPTSRRRMKKTRKIHPPLSCNDIAII